MASELDLLIQLKTQMVTFLDELIESFPEETDFIIFRIFIKDQIPVQDVMNYIVFKLIPLQNMVKERDENFFLNNNILFEKFDNKKSSKVNHFKQLWLSKKVDKQDKNVIWTWFESFIYLASKYCELKNIHSN